MNADERNLLAELNAAVDDDGYASVRSVPGESKGN